MSGLRILVATDQWFPDIVAGPARLATDTARGLAERGHEVAVLAPQNGRVGDAVEDGVAIQRVLARGPLPQTLTDPLETWWHSRRVAGRPHDVLLAHESTTAVGLLAQARRTPLVYMFHASAAREQRLLRSRLPIGLRRAWTNALVPPLALLERRAVAAATSILVLSDFSRSILVADHEIDERRITKVDGIVDTERFAPGDGAEAARARLGLGQGFPVLLTARRLEPRMGIDRLLGALALLENRDALLAIAGTGSLDAELRSQAGALGLGDRVRFLGRIPDPDLVEWIRAADLFVLPTTAYEGFGMATAEALATGTAVVGTPIGATPELLAPLDPRLVSESAEPDALARAVDSALAFAATPEFRARCREYAEGRFALATAITSWEDALVEAAGAGARR
ncbi:MAG: glycosyltransferase family 4 protein [Gaiellaceae bacterium]